MGNGGRELIQVVILQEAPTGVKSRERIREIGGSRSSGRPDSRAPRARGPARGGFRPNRAAGWDTGGRAVLQSAIVGAGPVGGAARPARARRLALPCRSFIPSQSSRPRQE